MSTFQVYLFTFLCVFVLSLPSTSALLARPSSSKLAFVPQLGHPARDVKDSIFSRFLRRRSQHSMSADASKTGGNGRPSGQGEASPLVQRVPWGLVYGVGFGALTASRISHEAHLQGFYINSVGLPPSAIGAGWSLFCLLVAFAEPVIGVMLDRLRSRGISPPAVLRILLLPWLMFVYLIWTPASAAAPWSIFLTVITFGLLQATMNLGLLSVYPTIFPSKEARAKALVPQQAMTIIGLLLGMTTPAILSDDWQHPHAFSAKFVFGLAAATIFSIGMLQIPHPNETKSAGKEEEKKVKGSTTLQFLSIFSNRFFRLILATIFMSQIGNALLASTLPLFAKHVIDLSTPVGPCLYGLIPSLDSKWQFSLCYLVFYIMGVSSGPFWAHRTQKVGAIPSLRRAFVMYGIGCALLPILPGGLLASSVPCLYPFLTTPEAKVLLFAICYIWNGFALGGMVALPDLIIAEAVNADEQAQRRAGKEARSRAGSMYGAKQLVYRIGSAMQGLITGAILSMTGFTAGAAVQSASSKMGLSMLVGFIPCACYLAGSLVLARIQRLQAKAA